MWTAPSDKEETAGEGLVINRQGDLISPSPSFAAPWDEEHVSLANNQCGPEATAMDASLEANPTPKSCKESDMAEHKHTHRDIDVVSQISYFTICFVFAPSDV